MYASERRKELQKKGSRNPATGGDTSLTMQYEFSGMSERGILYGTRFEEYIPFADAPAYEVVYPMEAKVLAGVGMAVLMGVTIGLVAVAVVLLAPVEITVAGVTLGAVEIGGIIGTIAASVGINATAFTAKRDDGHTSIEKYLDNSFKASTEVGGALIVLAAAPSAARAMISKANPLDLMLVQVVGDWYVSGDKVKTLINAGVYGVAGLKVLFESYDLQLFFMGKKELGEATGDPWFDEAQEYTDLLALEILFWGILNPSKAPNNKTSLGEGGKAPTFRAGVLYEDSIVVDDHTWGTVER